jgi:hypothetical protein
VKSANDCKLHPPRRSKAAGGDTHDGQISLPKSAAPIDRYQLLAHPPSQRRKVRNGPRPANRAAAEATVRALEYSLLRCYSQDCVPELSLHRPPGACSSRPVPHSPPALARSGHPVGCHAAREPRLSARTSGGRAARQPTAWPSARPAGAVAAPAQISHALRTQRHRRRANGVQMGCKCPAVVEWDYDKREG